MYEHREATHVITATTIIVCQKLVLLHKHPKYKKWLPVGGHVEPGERFDKAALREIDEETGLLQVTLWNPLPPLPNTTLEEIVSPAHILQYSYGPKIITDLLYYASSQTTVCMPRDIEQANSLKWFFREELVSESIDEWIMPSDVRELCYEALQILGT